MIRRIENLRYALVLALCFAVVIVFTANGEAAEFKKEYKLQINVGSTFYWGMGAQKFSDLVKERTNGQIIIKPHTGVVLC